MNTNKHTLMHTYIHTYCMRLFPGVRLTNVRYILYKIFGSLKICVCHAVFLLPTLKKQVGCFNHRVVALVAIMSGLFEVPFGIRDLIALGNQRGSCSGHLTTTILLIVTTTM